MSAKVISLFSKKEIKTYSDEEVFFDVTDSVIDDWRKYAVLNKLNDYITSKIPEYARFLEGNNYTSDLNAISHVEQMLNMSISIKWPGTSKSENPHGWVSGFYLENKIFHTPIVMSSEAYARAMCVVLYISFKNRINMLNKKENK